jgi:hypothetical protein
MLDFPYDCEAEVGEMVGQPRATRLAAAWGYHATHSLLSLYLKNDYFYGISYICQRPTATSLRGFENSLLLPFFC